MPEKIKLEINKSQFQVILRALDVYSRMFAGQFTDIPLAIGREDKLNGFDFEKLVKPILFPELASNESYGISQVNEKAKIAYDIYQVMRHERYKSLPEKSKQPFSVAAHPPLRISKEKLPSVKIFVDITEDF